jgi:hypothetical protein
VKLELTTPLAVNALTITGAIGVTVSVAAGLVTTPATLVSTTRTRLPFALSGTLLSVTDAPVAPGMLIPLSCH